MYTKSFKRLKEEISCKTIFCNYTNFHRDHWNAFVSIFFILCEGWTFFAFLSWSEKRIGVMYSEFFLILKKTRTKLFTSRFFLWYCYLKNTVELPWQLSFNIQAVFFLFECLDYFHDIVTQLFSIWNWQEKWIRLSETWIVFELDEMSWLGGWSRFPSWSPPIGESPHALLTCSTISFSLTSIYL